MCDIVFYELRQTAVHVGGEEYFSILASGGGRWRLFRGRAVNLSTFVEVRAGGLSFWCGASVAMRRRMSGG